jgi:beta-lactamase class A
MKHLPVLLLLLTVFVACKQKAQTRETSLQAQIDSFAKSKKADIGVAIFGMNPEDTFFYNGDKPFTIMSVVKFPQAVGLLNLVKNGKLDLNQTAFIDSNELNRKTHSPFADEHPFGNASIILKDGFKYSVSKSDNIICDLYYRYQSTNELTAFLHQSGYKNINIQRTYRDMKPDSLFLNNSTPRDMVRLLRDFYEGKYTTQADRDTLLNIMRNTETGPRRLKGELPKVTIAHKTGTYFEKDSFINAINDVGIVETTDKKAMYYIVVFVNNSTEGEDKSEAIIAHINAMAYQYFNKKK